MAIRPSLRLPLLLALATSTGCEGPPAPTTPTSTHTPAATDALPVSLACFIDADGDGFGASLSDGTGPDCGPGFAPLGLDCDDADPAVRPGAPEPCDDGVDHDCDGLLTTCRFPAVVYTDEASAVVVGSRPNDRVCQEVNAQGDLDHDGYLDMLVSANIKIGGDPGELPVYDSKVYVLRGPVWGEVLIDGAFLTFTDGNADSGIGLAQATGDLNRDGWRDVILGAPNAGRDLAQDGPGAVAIEYEIRNGLMDPLLSDAVIWGSSVAETFGSSVEAGGDMDGDGVVDLVVADLAGTIGGLPVGSVSVFYEAPLGEVEDSTASAEVVSDLGSQRIEAVANDGDLDGDGLADLAIGSAALSLGAPSGGAVHVFFSPIRGRHLLTEADAVVYSTHINDLAGTDVTAGGDLNGDGFDDLVVGAPGHSGDAEANDQRGRVYVVYGPLRRGPFDLAAADVIMEGEAKFDHAGSRVYVPGDLDGDGVDELLVGASGAYDPVLESSNSGAAYLSYGPLATTGALKDASTVFRPIAINGQLGFSLAAGDLDSDGYPDLVIGAPGPGPSADFPGHCYVFSGAPRKVPRGE